ncbi:5-dehydro-4-deoxy-D-glucuronate isomerase [Seonamhaeicola algicola]|uniref:4-deoxy-L-threo-5-hexosulose-uronate ketol-isomerase n=1 Tax=Seonamhaeicola algicola TaxID=1719036 RepID=A0A5C7AGW6_9FLAO|nr:5-dehydro-4-deoxy-D-glucuronate isomerase [Seonamhaeicola algicola]TXE07244.1 5-dehydro-4-deoxy-D-glucuronate isomerase [Seonamhaeicola algicola]
MTKITYDERYEAHPEDVKTYGTQKLRDHFLIDKVFVENKITLTYTHYDRYVAGGAVPVNGVLNLEAIEPLKAEHFCNRREVGVINIGGEGTVTVDGTAYVLNKKEAIYIGMGAITVTFESSDVSNPALFYINSAPAHHSFPTKKIGREDANVLQLGSKEDANERELFQYIVSATVETCQLQMGITELKPGSVWNTMPAHTHNRRMEVYMYTDVAEGQAVCHFMGPGHETRHIWMSNNQAVISPPWSIHSGAGTSNYSFLWGMAGENLDFTDMDGIPKNELR